MHHHRHFVYNVYWATLRLTLQSAIAQHVSIMATRPRNNMNQTQELRQYFRGADSLSRRFVLFCLHPVTLVGWVKQTTCVNSVHISIAFFFFSLPSLFFLPRQSTTLWTRSDPSSVQTMSGERYILSRIQLFAELPDANKRRTSVWQWLRLEQTATNLRIQRTCKKLGWPECHSPTVNKL